MQCDVLNWRVCVCVCVCTLQLAGGVILGVALWLRHDPKTSNLLELELDGAHAPSTFYISTYLISPGSLLPVSVFTPSSSDRKKPPPPPPPGKSLFCHTLLPVSVLSTRPLSTDRLHDTHSPMLCSLLFILIGLILLGLWKDRFMGSKNKLWSLNYPICKQEKKTAWKQEAVWKQELTLCVQPILSISIGLNFQNTILHFIYRVICLWISAKDK